MEFLFIHNEWSDNCILNENNTIIRKNIQDEKGYYQFNNDLLIIKWDNWESNDYFIKFHNIYLDKILHDKKEFLNNINIYYKDTNYECILFNDKIINPELNSNGYFKIVNNSLIIEWNNSSIEHFFLYNNNYVEINYLILDKNRQNQKNNNDLKDEKKLKNNKLIHNKVNESFDNLYLDDNIELNDKNVFKLINGFFYSQEYVNNNLNNNYYSHHIDVDNNKNENLFYNLKKYNNNYLDYENYNKFMDKFIIKKNNISEKFFKFFLPKNLNLDKSKKKIITLSEWGYPPFGGGENWLLNISKIFHDLGYESFLICFSDGFTGKNFDKNNFIDLKYVKIIQMPYNLLEILKIINIINPSIINHQGIKRIEFMKIANVLKIPFITGFCFWNNIIKQVYENINILQNNKIEKDDTFNYICKYSYCYSPSEFVNDVIYKFFNTKLEVIQTITLKDDYLIQNIENYYISILNCHYNKGGFLIKYLLENLNIALPILLVYTEYDDKINLSELKELIKIRNSKNNINILHTEKKNVKDIYKKTKILLIPSLCDETFCRVAYEGKMNNIPIISTSSGNLKYLLKNYALFIDNNNFEDWKKEIEKLYCKKKIMKMPIDKIQNVKFSENNIKNKIIKLLDCAKVSKYNSIDNNIGIIAPWADQGLGIQARSYYNSLIKLGLNPYIFAFKPYHGNIDNNFLQNDKKEWDFDNIYYSPNLREYIDYFEMLNFIHDNKIKKIIIIEATFEPIFRIVSLLKMLNIYTYLIVNIECVKISEINYHCLFDKILCNNFNSYFIMNNLINNKCSYLGFHFEHEFFKKNTKKIKNDKKLSFVCSGGLNSISRKNIDLIYDVFYELFKNNEINDVELNILIQGVEIPDQLSLEHSNIIKKIKNFSYLDNLQNLYQNDIYIHLGGQEGLGLGFYEALYIGIPILTIDWTPNNEIVINNINGWLIESHLDKVYENTECLINRGIIKKENLKNKILDIVNNIDSTINIINNTIKNKDNFIRKNEKEFNNNFKKYLTTIPSLD